MQTEVSQTAHRGTPRRRGPARPLHPWALAWPRHGLLGGMDFGGGNQRMPQVREGIAGGGAVERLTPDPGVTSVAVGWTASPHSEGRAPNYMGFVVWPQTPTMLNASGLLWPRGAAGCSAPASAQAEANDDFPHQLPMAQCGWERGICHPSRGMVGDPSPQGHHQRGGPRAGEFFCTGHTHRAGEE